MAMLLFLAAPLSLQIGDMRLAGEDLFVTSLMLDGILVAAPLIVNAFIAHQRGFFVGNHPSDLRSEIEHLHHVLKHVS